MNKVEGVVYSAKLPEQVGIPEFYRTVVRLYIPSAEICISVMGERIAVYRYDNERVIKEFFNSTIPVQKILVDKDLVAQMENFLEDRDNLRIRLVNMWKEKPFNNKKK